MKKLIIGMAILGLALVSAPASAQLGNLLKKPSGGGGGEGAEALVTSFVESYGNALLAQSKFLESFGLQDQATQLLVEQQALSSGQLDKDTMEKTREVSGSAQEAIAAKMEQTPELDADSREVFTEGLLHYGAALVKAKETADSAQGVASSISGNPMAMTESAKTALLVAKEAPAYLSKLQEATAMVFSYAKRNNIEPPADATALLNSL